MVKSFTSCRDSCRLPKVLHTQSRQSELLHVLSLQRLQLFVALVCLFIAECPLSGAFTSARPASCSRSTCSSRGYRLSASRAGRRKPPSAGARAAGGGILKGTPRGASRLPIGSPRCQSEGEKKVGGRDKAHRSSGSADCGTHDFWSCFQI